ncbi:serine/threonine protein phosphatase 1 [Chitinophaga polysaccharea]|uniref:Serine/threonine protein phosphatase 1 n=1 Tax=Chitinophaga polysaccharea TaxID=1293035 RepID=A0A561P2L2_9BACT|nr:metallophosphoesterase family protein [Chitinophaga polysaccharea]TWF32337.1 serine/threonine protein phosphatase 1 [Chitinophaga polysaccharea]
MSATYVIGDIHGALKALKQLIARIAPKEADTLIFLGDYVDGWSESAGVLAYLMELELTYRCIFIKGNHDAWCESWLNGVMPEASWMRNGGAATIASYEKLSPSQLQRHTAFFNDMRLFYIDAQKRLFVHAGFTSTHGPEYERFTPMLYWDRSLWELALALDPQMPRDARFYPKRLLQFHEIYIGHTPSVNYGEVLPMIACNVHNVDTGAAFMGKISAMNIDTKEVWQSDTVQSFYPDEKGRNT